MSYDTLRIMDEKTVILLMAVSSNPIKRDYYYEGPAEKGKILDTHA
jgi:hypothetical protein